MSFTAALENEVKNSRCKITHELYHTVPFETDPIDSSFNQEHKPCTFHGTGKVEIPISVSAGREITYEIKPGFSHVLRDTEHVGELPGVKVREEYRGRCLVAWSPSPGIHIVDKAVMMYGSLFSLSQSPIFLDCEYKFNLEPGIGKEEAYDNAVGNIPELTSFQEELKRHPIHVNQRWFYSNPGRHWPLYKLGNESTLHKYTYRPYTSILRVKILNDEGQWIPQIASDENLRYITIEKDIPYPSLVGEFSCLEAGELKARNASDCGDEIVPIRDTIIVRSTDRKNYGSVETLTLKSGFPCYYFYTVAVDLDAQAYGFFGNFSSSTGEIGGHAITKMSMKVGDYPRFTDWGPSHFNVGQAKKFPSLPRCCGYNGYSLAEDPNNSDADSAPVLGGNAATTTILEAQVNGNSTGCYHLMCLMNVSRPIIFSRVEGMPRVTLVDTSREEKLSIHRKDD